MKVSLVGAGPGEKGLLTLKGLKRLQDADVVLFDRFVGAEIRALIPECAEKIDVGKTAGVHPVPQDEINRLLLERAKQGLNVVRLKGGDPFVFGRGGEELELLAENGIPFEIVPGVSSAIAGAAYAGIPVTHRDYASSLHIITGHTKNNENVTINYDALVHAEGTLVFMMGVAAVEEICAGCIAAGMSKDMPAAIVENAATGLQRKFTGTVESLPVIAQENAVESPAIIIIGEVCLLSDRYDWFGKRPLTGQRVIIARSKPGMSRLADELRELGCYVTELPGAKITPLTGPGSALEKALEKINTYSWLVCTSSIGVNVFFDHLKQTGFDIRKLHHLKIACIGTETEKEVNNRGIKAAYCPAEYNGTALAHGLSALVQNGEKLLIARAKNGAEDLTRILTETGIDFDNVAIYEKTYDDEKITYGKTDFVVFTSSSAVERFAKSAANEDFGKIRAVCIGERTAATAKSYGMEVFVSAKATIDSMVNKIKELCLQ
jgi:uroporphyrinogen III methyltransferase/synthase